jgi:2-oxoglutarate dehydrogenase E2 component (dihydrolipoamide succinyltransferase)
MSTEVKVPSLPESVQDATLVTWHKKPGDPVRRDENLADLETDKVVLEVPAPVNGIMGAQLIAAGTTVTSGTVLALLEEGDAPAVAKPTIAAPVAAAVSAAAASSVKLGPAAKRVAEERHVDPASVAAGSDRVSKQQLEKALDAPKAAPATPLAAVGERQARRVPMTRLRARIAQRLVDAQSTQALLTTFNEVDMHALMQARSTYKDAFEKQHQVRLGFMSFFIKAAVEALKRFPVINAYVDGGDILYHDYYDVGVAVSTDRGLIVPVLRDVDQMSFADVERSIANYAKKGREGTITLDDLSGGTFSITNGGVFGSLLSTPIVNSPQSAILGMHKIQERPVAVNGQVVIRPMMYLALTYDHRIIDGKEAVQFLVAMKEGLEDPTRLLLQV